MVRSIYTALFALLLLPACEKDEVANGKAVLVAGEAPSARGRVLGVLPEEFKCESIASTAALVDVFGSEPVVLDTHFTPPEGVADQCSYGVRTDAGGSQWSFDIDCRGSALDDAEALMVQYASTDRATAVMVGLSGLDYHDAALLFIDDNSPCYVRVLGPSADTRLRLARLVADQLTEKTAPMPFVYRN